MKGKSAVWSSVALFIIGIALIVLKGRDSLLGTIVFIAGVMFIIPSLINMAMLVREARRRKAGYSRLTDRGLMTRFVGWCTSAGGLGLGIAMLLTPGTFSPILIYIFAGILVLGGVYHFYILGRAYRPIVFPGWLYILPAALVAGGAVIFFTTLRADVPAVVLMTGIGLVVFSAATFIEAVSLYSFHKKEAAAAKAKADATAVVPAE